MPGAYCWRDVNACLWRCTAAMPQQGGATYFHDVPTPPSGGITYSFPVWNQYWPHYAQSIPWHCPGGGSQQPPSGTPGGSNVVNPTPPVEGEYIPPSGGPPPAAPPPGGGAVTIGQITAPRTGTGVIALLPGGFDPEPAEPIDVGGEEPECECELLCGQSYDAFVEPINPQTNPAVTPCKTVVRAYLSMKFRLFGAEAPAVNHYRIYSTSKHVSFGVMRSGFFHQADGTLIQRWHATCYDVRVSSLFPVPCDYELDFVVCADEPGTYEIIAEWGNVSCRETITFEPDECVCKLEFADESSRELVEGHAYPRTDELGICLGHGRRACPLPQALTLLLGWSGPVERVNFKIWSSMSYSLTGIRHRDSLLFRVLDGPTELVRVTGSNERECTREQAMPDAQNGKWQDDQWVKSYSREEYCCTSDRAPPLRLLVKLNETNGDMLSKVVAELIGQVERVASTRAHWQRLRDLRRANPGMTVKQAGDEAWRQLFSEGWEQANVAAVVRVTGANDRDLLCQKAIPIVRGGIIFVVYNGNVAYATQVMGGLRELCGRVATDNADFDWLGGTLDPNGRMAAIVANDSFCDPNAPDLGHPRGRALIRSFLCGTCCAIIMGRGGADSYVPLILPDAVPKDESTSFLAKHFRHLYYNCNGEEVPGTETQSTKDVMGTGLGTSGVARVTFAAADPMQGVAWPLWTSAGGVWVRDGVRTRVSRARVLAHELGHVQYACQGQARTGLSVPNQLRRDQRYQGSRWDSTINDLGEYDVIIKVENPVAEELGERPRFDHNQ